MNGVLNVYGSIALWMEETSWRKKMSELNLIDITNDDALMERVLRKSAEMQNKLLEQADGVEEDNEN